MRFKNYYSMNAVTIFHFVQGLKVQENTVLSLQREKSMIENHAGDLQKKGQVFYIF